MPARSVEDLMKEGRGRGYSLFVGLGRGLHVPEQPSGCLRALCQCLWEVESLVT